MPGVSSLLISELLAGYRTRQFSPVEIIEQLLHAHTARAERREWIALLPSASVRERARELAARAPESLPLYGIPFAVKDNIDLESVPTTAGCREYAYTAAVSAPVVAHLIAAGAIPVGKTSLDQFATGLTGTRSPWGAGSVRVPAAFNNLIGLKPTCGSLSTRGVVPACRSLDCVGVLALTAAAAARVAAVAHGFDPQDPYSRAAPAAPAAPAARTLGALALESPP